MIGLPSDRNDRLLLLWKKAKSLPTTPMKEKQFSWSKVCMKTILCGRDAILLSVQCLNNLHELTDRYYLNAI